MEPLPANIEALGHNIGIRRWLTGCRSRPFPLGSHGVQRCRLRETSEMLDWTGVWSPYAKGSRCTGTYHRGQRGGWVGVVNHLLGSYRQVAKVVWGCGLGL